MSPQWHGTATSSASGMLGAKRSVSRLHDRDVCLQLAQRQHQRDVEHTKVKAAAVAVYGRDPYGCVPDVSIACKLAPDLVYLAVIVNNNFEILWETWHLTKSIATDGVHKPQLMSIVKRSSQWIAVKPGL